MNPVVLIATHVRTQITSRTLEQLQKQSVVPQIVLVCSLYSEYIYYTEKFDGVSVMIFPNEPLGAKWNHGGYYASKYFKADPLIILGSDDLLGKGYIENICQEMESRQADFIGINRWWMISEKENKAYLMEYVNKEFPLGGGRAYSQRLLYKLNHKVFDTKRNKLLDDYGYSEAKKSGLKVEMIQEADKVGLNIISIKGDWVVMNKAESILKAKSCKIVSEHNATQILKELL
jgi:hypothetical protein